MKIDPHCQRQICSVAENAGLPLKVLFNDVLR